MFLIVLIFYKLEALLHDPLFKQSIEKNHKGKEPIRKSIEAKSIKEPKLVHAYVRSKLTVKDSVNALINDEGDLITNKKGIAKILNDHFHSIFVKESD